MSKVQLEAILKLVDVQINPQVFTKISQSVAGLPASLQQTAANMKNVGTQAGALNSRLQQTGQVLSNNQRAASLFLQRMAQFAILLPTFSTLNHALQGGVKFLFEFDDILRDIVRTNVKGLTSRMEDIGDAALKVAVDLGVTAQEVLTTTRTFVQAGLTIEDAQNRARLAIIATQVSTLSSADAVEFFLAATNQFGLSSNQLTSALDALVKVEDLAAVEAKDIADAFRTGGNSLAEFSKNIYDSIGLITALREQTRKSGSEIGTFFKTIQARIFAAGESRTALEALGVSVENLDGSLRPTLDVLNDLKKRFDRLSEAQAANAAKSIAGVRQYESLVAVLKALDEANKISIIGSQAAGAADLKRTITDEKLDRQLGKLIAQGQQFAEALGDAGIEDTLRNALKFATSLLKVFTSLVDSVSHLGGNLAPLLALGGVALGRSVFGLAKGNIPGGGGNSGGGVAPGQASFVGPLTQAQQAMSTAGKDIARMGNIVVNTGKAMGTFGLNILTNTTLSQKNGLQLNANTASLQQHITAIKEDTVALAKSQVAAVTQQKVLTNSVAGFAAITLVATLLPKAFDALEASLHKVGGPVAEAGAQFVGVIGPGAALAAQFAFLGPQAAAVAGAFGIVQEASVRLYGAIQDEFKAREEISANFDRQSKISSAEFTLSGGGKNGEKAASDFIDNLATNVKGVEIGKSLDAAIQKSLNETATSEAFKKLGISGDDLRESIFTNIGVIKSLVHTNYDSIKSTAEFQGRLNEFSKLESGLKDGTLKTGDAFGLLVRSLGAGEVEINKFTGELKRALDFKEFKSAQKVTDLADNIRTLGLELELAKAGPDALSDSVVKLKNELLLTERASTQTSLALQERLGKLFTSLNEYAVGLNPDGLSAAAFFNKIKDGVASLDQNKIQQFKEFIQQLPGVQRDAGEEILHILEDQTKNETALYAKRNDLASEQDRRSKGMFEGQAQASINAFESMRNFTSELLKFGSAVNNDVLKAFQSVTTDDIKNVLSGNSKLSDGVQQIILSAFGDDKKGNKLAKAHTDLNAVSDQTQAQLDILGKKLEFVNSKLADSSHSNEIVSLTAEKSAIVLSIEEAKQKGAIAATEAKIKVLEAERDVAKQAREEEIKRVDLLNKLKDASTKFDKELRDIKKSFKDFSDKKVSELLGKEADAQKELKDAQKNVIDSTHELSVAYKELIKSHLEFNGIIAETRIKNNLLSRDIGLLNGGITTFQGQLSVLTSSFRDVLKGSNITLQKRIDLERQLADQTLSFLQQAKDSIVQAGTNIFGQSPQENHDLGKGIAGLQVVADKLGGSFEGFLNLTKDQLSKVTSTLLSLPTEFRQQILSALSFLPTTSNIGGFSVDQLKQAIGQVGAGVSPDAGLPSIANLNSQQVEQLQKLQELALQDSRLQYSQVIAAQLQVQKAQEAVDVTKLLEQRAAESLDSVRQAVIEEYGVLEAANSERRELLTAVIAADDRNSLLQIEKEAELFAEQNSTFRDIGDLIVQGVSGAINARIAVIDAAQNVKNLSSNFKGHIPNFASGNLTPDEAAGLLHAGSREKKSMPHGAGLAVANTSEAIIPMHNRGHIPHFQNGNISDISAGVSAIRDINASVVAAISQSVGTTLANIKPDSGAPTELLTEILSQLKSLNDTNNQINTNTSTLSTPTSSKTTSPVAAAAQGVTISLQTQQNSNVNVTGLENLHDQIVLAVKEAASNQVDEQLSSLLKELDGVITALQERGLLTGFNQPR